MHFSLVVMITLARARNWTGQKRDSCWLLTKRDTYQYSPVRPVTQFLDQTNRLSRLYQQCRLSNRCLADLSWLPSSKWRWCGFVEIHSMADRSRQEGWASADYRQMKSLQCLLVLVRCHRCTCPMALLFGTSQRLSAYTFYKLASGPWEWGFCRLSWGSRLR